MAIKITPNFDEFKTAAVKQGGLQAQLQDAGRLPPVDILITPIDGSAPIPIKNFIAYEFSSSILIPVDTFSFTFAAPDDTRSVNEYIREGDIVTLYANGLALATGLIDTVQIDVDNSFGEKITISGRDLMGQLEEQDAVNLNSECLWGNNISLNAAVLLFLQNTRIQGVEFRNVNGGKSVTFATEPSESKLSALQRLLEPENALAWMSPTGKIIIGKPNMKSSDEVSGQILCSKEKRDSNVLSIGVIRQAATIPNVLLPVWSGQESVQTQVSKEQIVYNKSPACDRLRRLNHFVQKTIVTSTPSGSSPSDLSETQLIINTGGGMSYLRAYAFREIARQSQKERVVQAIVPGHYNEFANPYIVDTMYKVDFDRGGVRGDRMYLFQTDYSLSEDGQRTSLYFCNLGTIVAGVPAK